MVSKHKDVQWKSRFKNLKLPQLKRPVFCAHYFNTKLFTIILLIAKGSQCEN